MVFTQEKLDDHLHLKTYWKSMAVLNKYKNEEDGSYDPPNYQELNPECNLHQYH